LQAFHALKHFCDDIFEIGNSDHILAEFLISGRISIKVGDADAIFYFSDQKKPMTNEFYAEF
jgi:hypothetical protein